MNTRCVGGATVERPVPQFPAARKNDAVIDNAKSDGHDYPSLLTLLGKMR
jgi:hypothetical protein